MPRPPLILLPPSEGKAPGGSGPAWTDAASSFDALTDARRAVLDVLAREMRSLPAAAREKLLGVKAEAAAAATIANLAVTEAPTRPAIERYTGVLYDALDAPTLSGPAKRRLSGRVAIHSGLGGAVRPRDPIPDYKLKMGASLSGLGKLSTWWQPHLDAALGAAAKGRTLWDLRPNEHAAAWTPASQPRQVITVHFLDDLAGRGLVTVSHWNKLLKGALVRFMLEHDATTIDALEGFEHDGFRWEPDRTISDNDTITVSVVRRR